MAEKATPVSCPCARNCAGSIAEEALRMGTWRLLPGACLTNTLLCSLAVSPLGQDPLPKSLVLFLPQEQTA